MIPPKTNNLAFMVRAFRYRNYRLFFGGQIVSLIGTWATTVATSWLVYRLSGSALLLGIVGFSSQLPAFVLAPFAGLIIDRQNRHHIMILTQTCSMLQSLALAFLTLSGHITIPWLLALSVVQGLINAFDMPCRQAFVVDMIERKHDLGNAIALNSSMFNVARLVGPAIGGVLIATAGEGWCFLLDGVSYLAVIFALKAMTLPPRPPLEAQTISMTKRLKEGFDYAVGFRPIRTIMTLIALINLTGVSYTVLMPVFAGTVLQGGPGTLGLLMAAAGAGALTGALWLAARKSIVGLGRVISLTAGTFGIGLLALSFTRSTPAAIVFTFISGWGFMVQMAASNTILQTIVEDDKRGRVMSLFIMASIGTVPFGSLSAGVLSDRIGVPRTLVLSGLCCVSGAAWFYRQLPKMREQVRPIYRSLGIIPQVATGIEAANEAVLPEAKQAKEVPPPA